MTNDRWEKRLDEILAHPPTVEEMNAIAEEFGEEEQAELARLMAHSPTETDLQAFGPAFVERVLDHMREAGVLKNRRISPIAWAPPPPILQEIRAFLEILRDMECDAIKSKKETRWIEEQVKRLLSTGIEVIDETVGQDTGERVTLERMLVR